MSVAVVHISVAVVWYRLASGVLRLVANLYN